MDATVTKLPTSKKPASKTSKAPKKVSAKLLRRISWQHRAGMLLAAVATCMTAVSLAHIAAGVEHLTHGAVPHWQSWCVAIGLDVNYIGMELAGVVAALQHTKDKLHQFTKYGIPAIMLFSMCMNAIEFASGATNMVETAAGVAMGVVLPALVWLTYRVALVLSDV